MSLTSHYQQNIINANEIAEWNAFFEPSD